MLNGLVFVVLLVPFLQEFHSHSPGSVHNFHHIIFDVALVTHVLTFDVSGDKHATVRRSSKCS